MLRRSTRMFDPRDRDRRGGDAAVSNVLGQVEPGSIVDMRDGVGNRAQIVAEPERILRSLDAAGNRCATRPC